MTKRKLEITARHDRSFANALRKEAACGRIITMIAEKVSEGGGKAVMEIDIGPATDTLDGVNALFDNFDFVDIQTGAPLLCVLLKNQR